MASQAGLRRGGSFLRNCDIASFLPFIGPQVPFHEKGSKLILGVNNRYNHRFRDMPNTSLLPRQYLHLCL